ncbi:hypothetical protein INR49_004286 [Caranx melampygus]|nr:hypothetical protein INR49_004286 [Caranx melampygus]
MGAEPRAWLTHASWSTAHQRRALVSTVEELSFLQERRSTRHNTSRCFVFNSEGCFHMHSYQRAAQRASRSRFLTQAISKLTTSKQTARSQQLRSRGRVTKFSAAEKCTASRYCQTESSSYKFEVFCKVGRNLILSSVTEET